MKKKVVILAVLVGVMLCGCGASESSNDEMKKMQEQLAQLENKNSALEAQVAQLEKQLSESNDDKNDKEDTNADVNTTVDDIKQVVTQLESKLKDLEGKIANKNNNSKDADIKSIREEITKLNNKIVALEGQVSKSKVANTITEAELKGVWLMKYGNDIQEIDLSKATIKGNFIIMENGRGVYYEYIDGKIYSSEGILEKK